MNSISKKDLKFAAVVLAAGKGVRMKSSLSKILHHIAGKPMILRTIEILKRITPSQIILVASPDSAKTLKKLVPDCNTVIQPRPLGTADAIKYGLKLVKETQSVVVLYGDDSAFYKPQTILKVFRLHQMSKARITFITVHKEDPSGLGRIIRKGNRLIAIVEEKDASAAQKKINEVNASLYFFDKNWLLQNLTKIKPSSVSGELYITDLIAIAIGDNQKVQTFQLKDENEWQSVNTKEELLTANLKFQKKIHIMGIAGAGAAAAAGIAKGYGFEVTGCDLKPDSAYIQNLKGIDIQKGHDPSHIASIGHLIISPAVISLDPQNPEIEAAKKEKIPISTWQEFQGKYLQKGKFVISTAGAYGKSTTTAMISQILIDAHLDPTCEVGATVCNWGANFSVGKSKYYVCEADEYNDNFLNYRSDIAVILNLAWDHPDFFKSQEAVFTSYKKFIGKIKSGGTLIIPDVVELNKLASYVHSSVKLVKITDFGKLNLSVIGDFRRGNANAALTIAKILGLDLAKARKSIENFTGLGRRLEYKGQIGKTKVYDDYAVQPYTVLATANALKEKFKDKKVVLVFEPHTFSRIKTFFEDFVNSLRNTKIDRVLITNIYAARETGNSRELAIKFANNIGLKAKYTGSLEETTEYLKSNIKDFDVILSMGAGDVYRLYDFLKKPYG